MVKKKGKSKRTSMKDKYKIQKRTAETHRKHKKQAKRDAAAGKITQKKKKDPGIPNSWPFKADLLKEIQRTRERQQEQQKRAKEERQANLRALKEHQAEGGTARTIEELMAQAQQSQEEFASKEAFVKDDFADTTERQDNSVAAGQQSRRAYLRELRKVVDGSDVLLQVLDARDPINSRIHPKIEEMIMSRPDKKMVVLLNKIDLVPKPVVQAWLTHLRRSVPALAVRADKIVERKTVKKSKGDADDGDDAMSMAMSTATTSKSSDILGMEGLLQLLKNYARVRVPGKKTKTTIVVGIIGYPNVGKSSIINALKRTRAVGVSPRPGFTTTSQEVVLDRDVRLMDSPGVVFDDEAAWLGNCLNVDTLDDPIPAVQKLLDRCDQKSLLMTYKIPAFPPGDVMMFLAMVARKYASCHLFRQLSHAANSCRPSPCLGSYGRVLKGGIPDKVAAARAVLKDWNEGKIPYFTAPPTVDESHKHADAVIVGEFAPSFDAMDAAVLGTLQEDKDEMDFVQLNASSGRVSSEWKGFEDEEEDEEMEDGEDE